MDNLSIDWDILYSISYHSNLGKSLKNTLRKFDKVELFSEVNEAIAYYIENVSKVPYEYRIKSLQSCSLKYDKYYPSTEVEKVFNDLLGIRIEIEEYAMVDGMDIPDTAEIADMRKGKVKDDGYRGIHLYFQRDHFHYPIEIQLMTAVDRQFNEWLHLFLYKYVNDNSVGCRLRELYENKIIQTEIDFRREMQKLCVI